jgi:dihydrolipoamide dehydrogenase
MKKYDIIIIGGGPGGYVAAIRASQLGKKVCLIEKEWVGGTCLNIGCIPTKALIASAEEYNRIGRASEFGVDVSGEVSYSLQRMMGRKKKVVSRSVKGVEFLLKRYGVDVRMSRGELVALGEVKINNETLTAENIIIATGSQPRVLKGMEPDGEMLLTSRDALEIDHIPENLLIIGAGVIGIEMASFFDALGVDVTVVEMLDSILPTLYSDKMSKTVAASLEKRGLNILTSTTVNEIEKKEGMSQVSFSNGEESKFDRILVAVGRAASFDGIDIEELGIEMDGGFIKTDKRMKTNRDGIYAIGDVTGGALLAHKASREGTVAALNIAGEDIEMNYSAIPSCIFSTPPAAIVGITEKIASKEGKKIRIGEYNYIGNPRAHTLGEKEGYVRIITDERGVVLGGEIVGVQADTMISEIALACELRLNVNDIERVIRPHPTLSEMITEAFDDTRGKAVHKPPVKK